MFFCDKSLNMIEDRLIFDLIFHENLLPHTCDRNGLALMLRPPETAVNPGFEGIKRGREYFLDSLVAALLQDLPCHAAHASLLEISPIMF